MELENLEEALLRGQRSQVGFERDIEDKSRGGLANVIASFQARRESNRNRALQEQVKVARKERRGQLLQAIPEELRESASALPVKTLEGLLTKRLAEQITPKEKELSPFETAKQKALGKAQGEALGGGQRPLTVREKEREKALGKLEATDIDSLKTMESNLPELRSTVETLKEVGKKATFNFAGLTADFTARQFGKTTEGGKARIEYEAIVNNQVLPLLKQTFGAAFTVKEGEELKATLGKLNTTAEEKEAALNRFIEQKINQIKSKKRKLGIDKKTITKQPQQDLDLTNSSTDDLFKMLLEN